MGRRITLADVAPELRAGVKRVPRVSIGSALVRGLARRMIGRLPTAEVEGVAVEERTDAGRGVRLYRPRAVRMPAALLWIHGGGYLIGSAVQDERLCAETARALGCLVASVEYRLAPEHPFPAASDDCLAAWRWLQAAAPGLGVAPARVAIGGQSAGGGLAAGLVQRLHDAPGVQPAAQWLFCPMLDDRTGADRSLDAIAHKVWGARQNRTAWSAYLGQPAGAAAVAPYAAPARREDLSGLPPAWIGVGDIDLFLAEDRAFAERLRAAGVETELAVVPGGPHGFEAWAPDAEPSRRLMAQARAWLAEALGAA